MKVKVSYSPTVSEVNEVDLTLETTTRGEWVIGRSPDSDLVLDSPDVSRVHAKFFVKTGSYYFCDLGSRNGSIFNGKQAEKDRPYILSDGDVIRIADYVLILEEVVPVYEQPETVFRIIDPSLFSRPRSPENVSTPNVANPAPVSSEVEIPEINAVSPEINEISEVASTPTDDVIPSVEAATPENLIQPPEGVSETPIDVSYEAVELDTPVAAEVSPDFEEVEVAEVASDVASEVSLTQPDEAIAIPENIIETSEEESTSTEATHDEDLKTTESTFVQPRDISAASEGIYDEEFEAALEAEVTFVQPRDIFRELPVQSVIPEATYDEDFEAALEAEVTFVQPRDIFNEVPVEDSTAPKSVQEELVSLDRSFAEEVTGDVDKVDTGIAPEANELFDDTDIQYRETSSQVPHDVSDEEADLGTPVTIDEVEIVEFGSYTPASKTLTEPDDDTPVVVVSEVSDDEQVGVDDDTPVVVVSEVSNDEQVSVDDDAPVVVSEVSDSVDIQSLETTENEVPVSISETVEEVSEAEALESDETSEGTNVSELPQMIVERNIVLIAHESKKSELAEFVAQHQEFFSQSFTITWPSVSEVLHRQAGITISQQTPTPTSGGYQTIASLVGAGEIVAVIFLRDLLQPQPGQANEEALLRLCNINQVLLATNVPTAEAIVYYLKHI